MVELLRTKLYIPRRRDNLVTRPRLVERLNAGLGKKLTLISAPAGFGKTTLLSEWIPACPRPVTWLFLDEADNDPTQFWTYFCAALQGLHSDLGASAFALLQSPQAPPIKSILTELINDLAAYSDPCACVLDDYHFVDAQAIHAAMSYLVEHLPGNVHLVITTREDPDLPLARLRARDHLSEIRAVDLRFSQVEAEAFLREVMGLELSSQQVAALEERTEGWAVGLQLAGLSMQKQADKGTFIADFSGSHRYILDYLTDEVLRQQPASERIFLLQTSILERFNGSLCDAVTGRTDGEQQLAHLEAANLFLIPLDEERSWYRYHHLFSDLLRSQLLRSEPQSIPELYRRASCWFEARGEIQAAVEYALQDRQLEQASRLIETHALPKLYQGQVSMVAGWFERLPQEIIQASAVLCINQAWALVLQRRAGRWQEVRQALNAARLALERSKAGIELDNLVAGQAATIEAFIPLTPALVGKDPHKQIALAQEAQRMLPPGERGIRSINALNIGVGYKALADLHSARLAFDQTLEDGIAGGNYYAAIYGPINLVECELLVGDLEGALEICEVNIERFNRLLAGQFFPPLGALLVFKGIILVELNQLEEAERYLNEGLDLVRWTGEFSASFKGHLALARLHAAMGDRQATSTAIHNLETSWQEGVVFTRAMRQRILACNWPDDPAVRKEAEDWLEQSAVELAELKVVHTADAISEIYLAYHLNTTHTLACLAMVKPGKYYLGGWLEYLERQQVFAQSHGLVSWVVSTAIAQAVLYHAAGKEPEALQCLEAALKAAAPTGMVRIFVDECAALRVLVEKLTSGSRDTGIKVQANRLLDAMTCAAGGIAAAQGGVERLSGRELEVLRGLAEGLTYEEIGRSLYLSMNTVQFHVKNIYGKLQVNKRIQAIEKARKMNIL